MVVTSLYTMGGRGRAPWKLAEREWWEVLFKKGRISKSMATSTNGEQSKREGFTPMSVTVFHVRFEFGSLYET